MDSRRNFIGKVATGIAGTLAVPSAVLGANERIRLVSSAPARAEWRSFGKRCPARIRSS